MPEGQIQTPGFAVLDLRGGYDFTGKLTVSTRYSGTSGSCTPTRRRHAIIPHLSSAGRLSGEAGIPHTWPHFPARAARSLTGRGIHLASRICLYAQGPMISRQNPIDLILSPKIKTDCLSVGPTVQRVLHEQNAFIDNSLQDRWLGAFGGIVIVSTMSAR